MRPSKHRPNELSLLRVWGPPIGAALLIFVLSSVPGQRLPQHPEYLNVIAHILEYGALALLLARAFVLSGLLGRRMAVVLVVTAVCLGYGAIDEVHQFLTPYRVFDPVDMAVDGAAGLAGSLLYSLFYAVPATEPTP